MALTMGQMLPIFFSPVGPALGKGARSVAKGTENPYPVKTRCTCTGEPFRYHDDDGTLRCAACSHKVDA